MATWEMDDDALEEVRGAFDDLIANWGKPCRLVYPGKKESCPNCLQWQGGLSSNRWRTGGPIPFPNGTTCPLCNGSGKREVESSEDITLLVTFEPRQFFYPVPTLNLRTPYSVCQTKGFLTDLPKLKRANELVVETSMEGIVHLRFKLYSEGLDVHNIVQGRYAVCTWERV